jgi:acetyl esterase
MAITGRVYLERGNPVLVICGWGPGGGPRNVWIRRADGTEVVRPFRGLRKPTMTPTTTVQKGQPLC